MDTMKKAANEKRLETMRRNLSALEEKAETILKKQEISATDRASLLELLNVAYHESGKIEGAASIDGSAACEFCERMRCAAKENILVICGMCYAAADSWKEAAWRRHKLNARILSSVLFTREELATLEIPSALCRINEDGDTVNVTHGRNNIRIIVTHTGVAFGYWYKNTPAVDGALHAEGYEKKEDLPFNVRFIKSSLLIGFPAKPDWFTHDVFTVFPNKAETEKAIAAGAWECNGRKCKECKWHCYNCTSSVRPVGNIAEYLRCNVAARKEIENEYYKRMEA